MVGTPSDRVQVRDRSQLMHPGACALCGNGTCVEGYVDVDIYYDYEGQVYFCMRCAVQIAETIGCLNPQESKHLEDLNQQIADKCAELQKENDELNARMASWNALIGDFARDDNLRDPVSEEPQSEPEPVDEPSDSGEAEQPEPPKPVKKSVPARPKRATVRNESFQL